MSLRNKRRWARLCYFPLIRGVPVGCAVAGDPFHGGGILPAETKLRFCDISTTPDTGFSHHLETSDINATGEPDGF